MDSSSIFNSEYDEDCWVIRINEIVSETHHSVLKRIPVCIFHVPKSLSCGKPEAFVPQLVAIGPYTHFRPELYPMERIKIFDAKAVLDHFNKHELKQVVQEFRDTATFIRASYHKHLCLKDETLLYTVAIDALFLLNFFHKYVNDRLSGSFIRGLGDPTQCRGLPLTKEAIIRDILMVENQIPMFSLFKILQFESSEPDHSVQEYLGSMLLSFCKQHSPLKLTHSPACSEAVSKHCHVLDLMYHLVVSDAVNSETPIPDPSQAKQIQTDLIKAEKMQIVVFRAEQMQTELFEVEQMQTMMFKVEQMKVVFFGVKMLKTELSEEENMNPRLSYNEPMLGDVELLEKPTIQSPKSSQKSNAAVQKSSNYEVIAISFKKVKGVLTWTVETLKKLKDVNIPLGKPVKQHLDRVIKVSSQLDILSSNAKSSEEEEEEEDEATMIINIPCVRELDSVGVCFKPVEGGNMAIEFDETKGIFYLPVVKLDVNSEVIMRNLVAYEALTQPDFLIFTRYTELMRGIVDSVKDVKLLMKAGIIESGSTLTVEETDELFNGMSKSIGPTKTHKLDETINKVNKYYNDKRKANFFKASTDYVYRSWKFFTLLATFLLLAMTAIETVCTAYDCKGSESDQDHWVIRINQMVSETHHSIMKKIPVCIYHVPKSLSSAKPEAFSPQLIAIGPYTHFRPELYPMERFKIFAAKAVLDHFNKHDLKQVVQEFRHTATFIRASYHKYLDLKDETLLYSMAIDALKWVDMIGMEGS
ncbi:hypothetical protein V8G54_011314 [Vigna mungo]|uniref:Uncharacterized protein n=1 Tax=Vigna mungo TaxID=3915 RepID=A0AAQ3NSL9_VIGMU